MKLTNRAWIIAVLGLAQSIVHKYNIIIKNTENIIMDTLYKLHSQVQVITGCWFSFYYYLGVFVLGIVRSSRSAQIVGNYVYSTGKW